MVFMTSKKPEISDVTLLALLLHKDYYESYASLINYEMLDSFLLPVFRDLAKYHKIITGDANKNDFITWFKNFGRYTKLDSGKQSYIDQVLKSLVELEITEELKTLVVHHYKEQEFKEKMWAELEKDIDIAQIQLLTEEYARTLNTAECQLVQTKNLLVAPDSVDRKANGLKWRLNILNECIGPLTLGDFALFFGYTNTGKTACVISESVYMAQQLNDGCVLYLNNEESEAQMLDKIRISALGQPMDTIREYPDEANAALLEKFHGDPDRIRFKDIRDLSYEDIHQIIMYYRPKLIVIDQIDNIELGGRGNEQQERLRLSKLYKLFRRIANTVCPIICVCQSDASTQFVDYKTQEVRYQLYPQQSQLAETKVAKQAQMDYIVGIGQDSSRPNIRGICVSKSKYLKQSMNNKAIVNVDWQKLRYLNP